MPAPILKSQQLAYRTTKKRIRKATTPEEALQAQADDYAHVHRIQYFRIDDAFWRWLARMASRHPRIVAWFRYMFGGWPDMLLLEPINDKYCLACSLEIKTDVGSLHGRQIPRSKSMRWQISRSPEDTMRIIDEFQATAKAMRESNGQHHHP